MVPSLSVSSLLIGMLLASCALANAQWVVETNSFHIREPANVEGEYDSAIGDVSCPAPYLPKDARVQICCTCASGNNSHSCRMCNLVMHALPCKADFEPCSP